MASIVETRMILFTVTSRKMVNGYHNGQITFFEVGEKKLKKLKKLKELKGAEPF